MVDANEINWREELEHAKPDEGGVLPPGAQDVYLNAPVDRGNLPRNMIKEEIIDNWQDVSKAKIKEIICLYEFGCFKRCPRHISKNIIDARWVKIWKMIDGAVGGKVQAHCTRLEG